MKRIYFALGIFLLAGGAGLCFSTASAQTAPTHALHAQAAPAGWHIATRDELAAVIPARAPVGRERIETEMRTAAGVSDGKGKSIAGVVLITAGYSADGKYSHYFLTQVPIKIGSFDLRPGSYVIGWKHQQDSLAVSFYDATTEKLLGTVQADRDAGARVASFRMTPPGAQAKIFIGRFAFPYHLAN